MQYKILKLPNGEIIREHQKGRAYTRDGKLWYRFVIVNIDCDPVDRDINVLILKITSGKNKWLYSTIRTTEIDGSIKFNK